MKKSPLLKIGSAVAGLALSAAALSGCALTQGATKPSAGAHLKVAYLSASSANTWLAASRDAMKDEAKNLDVDIVEFDGKFEPGLQSKQIQDVITAGSYDGIILASVDGAGAIPAVKDALAAGLQVVFLNQIVGDRYDTADPQVPGVAASVLAPPFATGQRMGKLAITACAGVDPCKVAYMFGMKGTPHDTATREGFDSAVADVTSIKVVAEGEGGFLGTDQPMKATQDILQAHPDIQVFVGSGDQHVRGALLAFADLHRTDIKTIGVGGSAPALTAIADGTWFGDVAGVPADEGRIALEAMVDAVRMGKDRGGVDVTEGLPDGGLVTKDNVSEFKAQWQG